MLKLCNTWASLRSIHEFLEYVFIANQTSLTGTSFIFFYLDAELQEEALKISNFKYLSNIKIKAFMMLHFP